MDSIQWGGDHVFVRAVDFRKIHLTHRWSELLATRIRNNSTAAALAVNDSATAGKLLLSTRVSSSDTSTVDVAATYTQRVIEKLSNTRKTVWNRSNGWLGLTLQKNGRCALGRQPAV